MLNSRITTVPLWLAFLGTSLLHVNAHTFMNYPVPYPSQFKNNAPVAKDGSDWPCPGETEFDPRGAMNIWRRDSTEHLHAIGGASHGGGSCQISVSTDLKPNRYSKWTVIHSIEGHCPIRNLTDVNYGDSPSVLLPDIYNFTIPHWLPLGPIVMAWTWFGYHSVPELFMNCAPIMIMPSEKGRDIPEEVLKEKFRSAPAIFEANNGNGCWTTHSGKCVKFAEPGDSLERNQDCDDELRGTCGAEYTLATTRRPIFGSPVSLMVGVILFLAVMVVVVKKSRQGRAYKGISQIVD